MALRNRYVALVGGLVLVAGLAACGNDTVGGSTPTVRASAGGPSAPHPSPDGPGGTASASPEPSTGVGFVLAEGAQRDICGIRLRVTFIPPSVTTSGVDQAFLVGGPISGDQGAVPDPTGDQPLPENIAPARPGVTVTVMGKRFKVDNVDVANHRVHLEAIC